ncbi:hypothetical protein FQN57_001279 [Myotisia sp. PD_48]|nr:hypothetical protein FQN57_001279 [Myotisia sp. PD_48]
MPFHVYTMWRRDGFFPGTVYRTLLAFADREAADYFFRGIQENLPLKVNGAAQLITSAERLSPQLWNFYGSGGDNQVYDLVVNMNIGHAAVKDLSYLKELRGKILMNWLPDSGGRDMPIISDIGLPDRIDGGTFFIRSRLEPYQYWYVEDGVVTLSRDRKSKFGISLPDSKIADAVLVHNDKVRLTYTRDLTQVQLNINDNGFWIVGAGRKNSFLFGALRGGIEASTATIYGSPGDGGRSVPAPRLRWDDDQLDLSHGEVWELV